MEKCLIRQLNWIRFYFNGNYTKENIIAKTFKSRSEKEREWMSSIQSIRSIKLGTNNWNKWISIFWENGNIYRELELE